jgi:hypothetical protein
MNKLFIHHICNFFIALVWFVNGLFCKILNFIPRHQEIVGSILGDTYSVYLTKIIGFLELLIIVWIYSRIKTKLCTYFQISIILAMNIIELIFVKELLLFAEYNIVLAIIFCIFIYYNFRFFYVK